MSTAIESDAPVAERVENGGMSHPTPRPTPTNAHRSRRWWWIAAAVAVVVVAGVAWAVASGNGSTDEAADVTQRNFAAVVSTDLIQEESYDGTLGTVDADPIGTQATGTVTSIAAAGTTGACRAPGAAIARATYRSRGQTTPGCCRTGPASSPNSGFPTLPVRGLRHPDPAAVRRVLVPPPRHPCRVG